MWVRNVQGVNGAAPENSLHRAVKSQLAIADLQTGDRIAFAYSPPRNRTARVLSREKPGK